MFFLKRFDGQKLFPRELQMYSLVYSFCCSKEFDYQYKGSIQFLAELCQFEKSTSNKVIRELLKSELVYRKKNKKMGHIQTYIYYLNIQKIGKARRDYAKFLENRNIYKRKRRFAPTDIYDKELTLWQI